MNWVDVAFGVKKLPEKVIVLAGLPPSYKVLTRIKNIFDNTKKVKESLFKAYICKKKSKSYFLVVGLYGATKVLELVNLLKFGKCKNLLFIGRVGAIPGIEIGSILIPNKVRCLDGTSNITDKKLKYSKHSENLKTKVFDKLKEFNTLDYNSVSIPHIFHDIDWTLEEQSKYKIVDMELGPFLFFADRAKMNAVGIYIVSDQAHKPNATIEDFHLDKQKIRTHRLIEVVSALI